jgi:hypothetical protein
MEKKRNLVADGIRTPDYPARSLVNTPTSLFWFPYTISIAESADK